MGYCNQTQVESVLAQTLTSATNRVVNGSKVPLIGFGRSLDPNIVPTSIVDDFIRIACEEVDGMLSEMYEVPLSEKADFELSLLYDIGEYNDGIQLDKAGILVPGDVLVFFDTVQEERHVVDSITNTTTVVLVDSLLGLYAASETRVIRVKYPPPIGVIAARFAAANIYDKYFSAQVTPNVTDFGKQLRALATRDINNILNGRTVLHGQKRIGHRFFNPNLRDRYRLPGAPDSDPSRNMDDGKI
jgi:hypothetical protein